MCYFAAGLLDAARVEHVDMDAINALFSEVAKTGALAQQQQRQHALFSRICVSCWSS
jgi:hypothetical protein